MSLNGTGRAKARRTEAKHDEGHYAVGVPPSGGLHCVDSTPHTNTGIFVLTFNVKGGERSKVGGRHLSLLEGVKHFFGFDLKINRKIEGASMNARERK